LTLLSEIEVEIPIDVVKSIDELACTLDQNTSANPRGIATRMVICSPTFTRKRSFEMQGASLGSTELTFSPGTVRAGDYKFSVGTGAGLLCFKPSFRR
jgi:hypothetical protein